MLQPKVIQKLRPYYTYMHLRLCHIHRQRLYKTVFDSTLIPHDNVRVLRLKHTETQTEKKMNIVKHLEKYDSSNHHIGHLRKRALRG